jgi:hypothetical protein
VDLPITGEQVADLIDGFDWRKLPEYPVFHYHQVPRKSMSITFSDLGYALIDDYCRYHDKSFSTAIMQALAILEVYETTHKPTCLGSSQTAESSGSSSVVKDCRSSRVYDLRRSEPIR